MIVLARTNPIVINNFPLAGRAATRRAQRFQSPYLTENPHTIAFITEFVVSGYYYGNTQGMQIKYSNKYEGEYLSRVKTARPIQVLI